MKKEQLLELLKQHKKNLTTIKNWDVYAKDHGLPPAVTLIYHFESWSNVKKELGLPLSNKTYTFSELEKIAFQHKLHFLRKSIWDNYSKEHGLPASATFIKAFGSWEKVKKHIGVSTEKKKNDLYSKEDIRLILKEHSANYLNRKQWDEYAKGNKLPTYKTLKKHFEYDEILTIIKKKRTSDLTKAELIRIALKHREQFLSSSMAKWDIYATEYQLPSSFIFHKIFGSWRMAKGEISIYE